MEKIASTKRQKRKTNRTFRFNNAVRVINIEKEGKGNPVGNTYKTKTKPNSVKTRPLANPLAVEYSNQIDQTEPIVCHCSTTKP
jgi:hypothetical protein